MAGPEIPRGVQRIIPPVRFPNKTRSQGTAPRHLGQGRALPCRR
jgi:hypothetical protein